MMRNKEVAPMKNKSTLAKLLANEDVFVIHKQMETAYFNSKSRELGLPIWKDEEMTKDIYDLMVCHEIGHALWTPLDMLESAALRNINHSFVNIIEDARIERKVKNKYAGTLGVFNRGYNELTSKDFFGTADKDISALNLIDRINLFFKGNSDVTFSEEEKVWVDRTAKTKTPDDVLDLAEELYTWMEENESETDNHDNGENGESVDSGEEGEGSASGEKSEGDDNGDSDNGTSGDESKSGDDAGNGNGNGEREIDGDSDKTDDGKSAGLSDGTPDNTDRDIESDSVDPSAPEGGIDSSDKGSAPIATTDTASKDGMDRLRDKAANDRDYGNIPKLPLDKVIVNYSDLLKEYGNHYASCINQDSLYYDSCVNEVNTLKVDSKKTVSYMVKEFEMKKAADAYARAAVSKTGSLDMGRLHTYKFNDDIFKKVTTLPGATNHGMVMCLDWSGSMCDNLKGTLAQLFNLIWFCRQTRIPFEVFAFSDSYNRNRSYETTNTQGFKYGDMKCREFKMLNFFSSSMTVKEELEMMVTLTMYQNRYIRGLNYDVIGYPYVAPRNLELGGTPLNEAIIAMMDIVPKFKSDTGVQKVNTVFLTDGAANGQMSIYDYDFITNKERTDCGTHVETTKEINSWRFNGTTIITDPVTNKSVELEGRNMTTTLLKMLKARVYDMNIVGFFIAGSGKSGRVDKNTIKNVCKLDGYNDTDKIMELVKKINKEKFLAVDSVGYDEYYILPGGNSLEVENDGLGDELIGASKAKLKSAFGKSMKSKIESRVLLNKFVKLVA
jgi:hypothetical protein